MNGQKFPFDHNQSDLKTSKISITRLPIQTNEKNEPSTSAMANNTNSTTFKVHFSDNVIKQVNFSNKSKPRVNSLSKRFGELQNNNIDKPAVNLLGWELEENKTRKTLKLFEQKYLEDSSIEKDKILSPILDIITKKINSCTLSSQFANSLNLIFKNQKQISYNLFNKKDKLSDLFGQKRQAIYTDLNKIYLEKKYSNLKPQVVALKETDEIFFNFTTLLMNALIRINSNNLDDIDLFNKIYYEKHDNIYFDYNNNLKDKKNFNMIFLNQLMNEIHLTLIDDKDLTDDQLKKSKLYASIHLLLMKSLKLDSSNLSIYLFDYYDFTNIYYNHFVYLKSIKFQNMSYFSNEFKIFIFDMFTQLRIELNGIEKILSPIYFLMNHDLTTITGDPRKISNLVIQQDFKRLYYRNEKENVHIKTEHISDELIKQTDSKRSEENKKAYKQKTYDMNVLLVEAEYEKNISSETSNLNPIPNEIYLTPENYQINENLTFQCNNLNSLLTTQEDQLDLEALNLFNFLSTLPAINESKNNSNETIFQNLNDDFFSNSYQDLNPIGNEPMVSDIMIFNESGFHQTLDHQNQDQTFNQTNLNQLNVNNNMIENFLDLNDSYISLSNNDISQIAFNNNLSNKLSLENEIGKNNSSTNEIIQKEENDQLIDELIMLNDDLLENQSTISSSSQEKIDELSFIYNNERKTPIIKIKYKEMDCNLNSSLDETTDVFYDNVQSPIIQLESPTEKSKTKKVCLMTSSRNILKNVLDQNELNSCDLKFQDIKNSLKDSANKFKEMNLFKKFENSKTQPTSLDKKVEILNAFGEQKKNDQIKSIEEEKIQAEALVKKRMFSFPNLFKSSSRTLLSPNINDFNTNIQIKEDRTSTPIKMKKSCSSSEDEEFFKTKKKHKI